MNPNLVGPTCLEATGDQTIFANGLQEMDLSEGCLSFLVVNDSLSAVVSVPSDFISDSLIGLF